MNIKSHEIKCHITFDFVKGKLKININSREEENKNE